MTGPFPPEQVAALVAAIGVNDRIDPAAELPGTVAPAVSGKRLAEGFRLSRQLWREGFDWMALRAMAASLHRGDTLSVEDQHRFKQIRARFKHLRFAYFLYDRQHRSPRMLSLVTLVLGELQDSFRVRGRREIRRHARRLLVLLLPPGRFLLRWETGRFAPADAESFHLFIRAQVGSLRPLLADRQVSAHAFHAARKVVSRQVSFHDDMRTLYDSDDHRRMARWLATLNGLMGKFHDELVARDAAGTFRYRGDTFTIPDDIRERLQALVDLYFGTSSSEPPSA